MNYHQRFIVLEGPDGSGKTTHFRRTLKLLEECGAPVCEVREPGGTNLGEKIRQVLLDHAHQDMFLRAEMLLYMASRAQLMEQRILPALRSGHIVLADRFVSSTFAYQGAAGGLPKEEILAAANIAINGNWPARTDIFDVDEVTAATRISPLLASAAQTTREIKGPDRIESKGREFHRKVRKGYLELAAEDPQHFNIFDASKGLEEVWRDYAASLCKYLTDNNLVKNTIPLKQYLR